MKNLDLLGLHGLTYSGTVEGEGPAARLVVSVRRDVGSTGFQVYEEAIPAGAHPLEGHRVLQAALDAASGYLEAQHECDRRALKLSCELYDEPADLWRLSARGGPVSEEAIGPRNGALYRQLAQKLSLAALNADVAAVKALQVGAR